MNARIAGKRAGFAPKVHGASHLPVSSLHHKQGRRRFRRKRFLLLALVLLMFLRKPIYDAWSLVKVGLIRIRYGGPRPPPVCRSTSRPTIDLGILPDFPSVEEEFLTPPALVTRPRVAVVTLCDELLGDICAASIANKRAYADRHGYTLIVANSLIDPSRPTAWTKILAVEVAMESHDLVFWTDIDTLIMNPNVRVQDLMDYRYDQMLAADHNGLNSGVWLLRSTAFSRWFARELWAQGHLVHMPFGRSVFHYEQRAFHFLYQTEVWRRRIGDPYPRANTVRAHTNLVHQCVFNSLLAFYQDGDFVVHLAGVKGVAKCLMFRRYYRTAMRMFGVETAGPAAVPTVWHCLMSLR